jgi:hypothetical protein
VSDKHREPLINGMEEEYRHGTPWTMADIMEPIQEQSTRPVYKNSL